jgi:hypothetical protein
MRKPTLANKTENLRQTHLQHEGAIMATGLLFYLMALGLMLAVISGVALKPWKSALSWSDTLWVGAVFASLAVFYAIVGHGLRSLATWSRYAAGALTMLCLSSLIINPALQHPVVLSVALIRVFAMPIGIVITLYAAYLALFGKGSVVLSPAYRAIAVQSPQDYRLTKVFLATGIVLVTVQSLKVLMIFTGRMG